MFGLAQGADSTFFLLPADIFLYFGQILYIWANANFWAKPETVVSTLPYPSFRSVFWASSTESSAAWLVLTRLAQMLDRVKRIHLLSSIASSATRLILLILPSEFSNLNQAAN